MSARAQHTQANMHTHCLCNEVPSFVAQTLLTLLALRTTNTSIEIPKERKKKKYSHKNNPETDLFSDAFILELMRFEKSINLFFVVEKKREKCKSEC